MSDQPDPPINEAQAMAINMNLMKVHVSLAQAISATASCLAGGLYNSDHTNVELKNTMT